MNHAYTPYKYFFSAENGLCPVWCVPLEFTVHNPECAFIRFVVYDEDMFGEPNQIGQCTYPVSSLKFRYIMIQRLKFGLRFSLLVTAADYLLDCRLHV